MRRSTRIKKEKMRAAIEEAFLAVLTISVFGILVMALNVAGGAI